MRSAAAVAACALALGTALSAAAGNVIYTYDALGRVTSVTYADGTIVCYAYDQAGNRLRYTVGTTACFAQTTHTYSGPASGTETVPSGASFVTITMWSGGAAGGRDSLDEGGGGGGGCKAVKTIAVAGGNTMTYTVAGTAAGRSSDGLGANGSVSSVSGTVAGGTVSLSTSSIAHGGGLSDGNGAGAICSGGTDTNGGIGDGFTGGAGGGVWGGAGGAALGASGNPPGGAGAGAISGSSGTGAQGQISFSYY